MSKRKETPDVLGEVLGGQEEQPAKEPAKQRDRQTERQSEDDPKIKATHYLRQSTLYRLEEALIKLRMATDNRGLSRYEVVEEAIQMALEELETGGEKSQLATRLTKR